MKKLTIPKYTLGEEVTNSITHGLGVFFGIVILVLTIVMSAHNHNTVGVVASCIYGTSMIIMFLISCLYHAMSPRIGAKKVFRVLDHCDIYVFIAGSYTPFCIINLEKYKIISFLLYLIMGWMILISFNSLNAVLPSKGLFYLLSGGVVFTIGAALYGIGHKVRYMHSVFHLFVLAGCILQSFSILFYAI